jgi:hypothetical protein
MFYVESDILESALLLYKLAKKTKNITANSFVQPVPC